MDYSAAMEKKMTWGNGHLILREKINNAILFLFKIVLMHWETSF